MVDSATHSWPVEEIPDPDRLFLRVHAGQLRHGKLHPGIFKVHEDSLSVDWERYSTAEETRLRALKDQRQTGVVALIAGIVRSIENLQVLHDPLPSNRAHSGVFGIEDPAKPERKVRIRSILFDHFKQWEIEPPVGV
jgi:hypothetical protein